MTLKFLFLNIKFLVVSVAISMCFTNITLAEDTTVDKKEETKVEKPVTPTSATPPTSAVATDSVTAGSKSANNTASPSNATTTAPSNNAPTNKANNNVDSAKQTTENTANSALPQNPAEVLKPTPTNGSTAENPKTYKDENLSGYKGNVKPMGMFLDVDIKNLPNGNFELSFLVSRSFLAEVKVLNFPYRLLIDIPMPYKWDIPKSSVDKRIPVTLIESFRYGHPSEDIFRVVADLSRPVTLISVNIKEDKDGKFKLTVEFAYGNKSAIGLLNKSIAFNQNSEALGVVKEAARLSNENYVAQAKSESNKIRINSYLSNVDYPLPSVEFKSRPILVMVDPGHGGKDPGAASKDNQVLEKDVVLEISKYIKKYLETNQEVAVVLTRNGDYYLPLKDRILWAEYFGVDLFVSIHADKSPSGSLSSGMSIYTLSEVASDAQAQLLANNANKSDLVAGVDFSKEDDVVNRILTSLYQRVKVNDSISLAQNIIMQSANDVPLLVNPLRSAGFAVLKVPNTPSVLVETGFLSSKQDLENLTSTFYKDKLAKQISAGILAYLFDRKLLSVLPANIDVEALKNANTK